jgi:hypothetical protein
MKTTVELPDALLRAAKRKALENRTTLRAILERALRQELKSPARATRPRKIRCVTSPGGLPPGVELSDRSKMWEWMENSRAHHRH